MNQCDGCRRGLPLNMQKEHQDFGMGGVVQICTKDQYTEPPLTSASKETLQDLATITRKWPIAAQPAAANIAYEQPVMPCVECSNNVYEHDTSARHKVGCSHRIDPTTEINNVNTLFHRLWTNAVGTPNYRKGEWRLLGAILDRAGVTHQMIPEDLKGFRYK